MSLSILRGYFDGKATQQDQIRRVREALHTDTADIDENVNLDFTQYGEIIVDSAARDAIGILKTIYEGSQGNTQCSQGASLSVQITARTPLTGEL